MQPIGPALAISSSLTKLRDLSSGLVFFLLFPWIQVSRAADSLRISIIAMYQTTRDLEEGWQGKAEVRHRA